MNNLYCTSKLKISVCAAIFLVAVSASSIALATARLEVDWLDVKIRTEDGDVLIVNKKSNGVSVTIYIEGRKYTSEESLIKVESIANQGVGISTDTVLLKNGVRDKRRYVRIATYDHSSTADFVPSIDVEYGFSPIYGLCSVKVSDKDGGTIKYVEIRNCDN